MAHIDQRRMHPRAWPAAVAATAGGAATLAAAAARSTGSRAESPQAFLAPPLSRTTPQLTSSEPFLATAGAPLVVADFSPAVEAGTPAARLMALGGAVGLLVGRQRARRDRSRRQSPLKRRFFNPFGPAEVTDPEDPGRPDMCSEYQNMGGQFVCAEESDYGWALVSNHKASEQDGYWPGGDAPGEITQEWRELRLAATKDNGAVPEVSTGTGQSVVKVSLCSGAEPAQVPYCAALGYIKTAAALLLSGAHAQGALPLSADGAEPEMPPMRALVVGLGAGSLPLWLAHTFPKGSMTVDAVEIDPAVVTVATGALGFPKSALRPGNGDAKAAAADATAGAGGEAVRLYAVGGEAFVEALGALQPEAYRYDMVFVDAFDKSGKVPPVLVDPEGPFLKPLSTLLTPTATLALNLLVGMSGSGSSGGPAEIEAMISAIHKTCCTPESEVFTVRTPMNESSGNQLYGFLRAGRQGERSGPLKEALRQSSLAVNGGFPVDSLGKKLRFEFARRMVFAYRDWAPKGETKGVPEKQNGGVFGFF